MDNFTECLLGNWKVRDPDVRMLRVLCSDTEVAGIPVWTEFDSQ
jgi:hypothetical protein